jgi:hypothetical protein
MTYSGHGHGPYLIAAGVGRELGSVIINRFPRFGDLQDKILRKWYGDDPNIFIDEGSGKILAQIDFFGDYRDFVRRNLAHGKEVRKELRDYLRGFEAVSLSGERREFSNPEISISAGARFVPDPEKTFYVFPALTTEMAKRAPSKVDHIEEFISIVRDEEVRYKGVFLPEITTFSYTSIEKLPQEISTPPLTHRLRNDEQLPRSIYYNLSGASGEQDRDIIRAVQQTNLQLYRAPETDGPGLPAGPSIIFNTNCLAQVARAGWGTIWMCQLAEKPIIAPKFRENDEPEVFHNLRTIEKFGLGVVFQSLIPEVIDSAVSKIDSIKDLNRQLLRKFGTLDGLQFVAGKIRENTT